MVRVSVVVTVGDALQHSELLAVALGEAAGQSLGGRGQYRIVMMIALAELIDAVAHIRYDLQSQFLCLFRLSVVLADEGNQAFGQSDEADT